MDHFRGTREGLGADGNGAWNDRAEPWKAKAIVRCFVVWTNDRVALSAVATLFRDDYSRRIPAHERGRRRAIVETSGLSARPTPCIWLRTVDHLARRSRKTEANREKERESQDEPIVEKLNAHGARGELLRGLVCSRVGNQ